MKVSSVRFFKSAQKPTDFPRNRLQEIAFVGRSNVGKSSLLNSVVHHRRLARTSKTPGRTQTINFYLVNDRVYFVDLPGYGFAAAPESVRESWRHTVNGYLKDREHLKLVLLLVDCRLPPTENDVVMKEYLDFYGVPYVVVLTKADKLSRSRLSQSVRRARTELEADELIPFSAVTGLGRESILGRIGTAVS